MAKIVMMSAKMATPELLKVKLFWNKGYYVIYYVYDVTNKILSYESNYIVDVVTWPKSGYSSICIKEVIINSILWETTFFERWSWFKFNNLGLALGANLKFYTSLSRGLKLKVKKFWGLILTFVEVKEEKLLEGAFLPHTPILSRINIQLPITYFVTDISNWR